MSFGFRQNLSPKLVCVLYHVKMDLCIKLTLLNILVNDLILNFPLNHILIMFCVKLTLELLFYIDLKIVFHKVLVRNWLHNKISGLNYFDVVYQTASKYDRFIIDFIDFLGRLFLTHHFIMYDAL